MNTDLPATPQFQPTLNIVCLVSRLDEPLIEILTAIPAAEESTVLIWPVEGDADTWLEVCSKKLGRTIRRMTASIRLHPGRVYLLETAGRVSFREGHVEWISGEQGQSFDGICRGILDGFASRLAVVLGDGVNLGEVEAGLQEVLRRGGLVYALSSSYPDDFPAIQVCGGEDADSIWEKLSTSTSMRMQPSKDDWRRGHSALMQLVRPRNPLSVSRKVNTPADFSAMDSQTEHFDRHTGLNVFLQQSLMQEADQVGEMGAWELDPETSKVSWSEKVRILHEVGEDFAPEWPAVLDFVVAEDRGRFEEAVSVALETGVPFDLDVGLILYSGTERALRVAGYIGQITRNRRLPVFQRLHPSCSGVEADIHAEMHSTNYAIKR